ncbi:hypothetical protein [Photobacterium phosphoreum]|uniref:hypothetical protein n=1 Tax=Photobacterium phosphoreum TaxID=659 RepID=UPI001E4ED448|nr:hypothetical protein [Photobacterium phosphoreum]MCD9472924.1 hypothetical protein [Photobacterium phosphoreum]
MLHLEISESTSEFSSLKIARKISVEDLSEFLRILSVSYATAQNIDPHEKGDVNIDTCLREIFLVSSELANQKNGSASLQFSNSIDRYHQTFTYDVFSKEQLEIISISYNSPLKITISGRSLRNLVIAVALLGGEVNMTDYSVKMPGIADMVSKLSTTYIEIQKFKKDSESAGGELKKYLKSLPHQDVNTINSIDNRSI